MPQETLGSIVAAGAAVVAAMDGATEHASASMPDTQDFRQMMQETLGRIAAAAAAVEVAMGGAAQDTEGVVTADGRVWVVQTRPQV